MFPKLSAILPPMPRATDWIFSLKTFAAGMLALFIGLYFGLEKPYWALATVYITSTPMSGALSSKAVYRVAGTAIGATAAVVLVPLFVNAPEFLSLALALWVGGCLAISLLDRTPRSYLTMLSGYTAALIGFSSVSDPGAIFDTATARVEEIVLGITCAGLVGHLVFPRHAGPMVAQRMNAWLKDAAALSLDAFRGDAGPEVRRKRAKLAFDATELHGLAVHLAYDHSHFRGTTRQMQALRGRMLLLLPLLGGIGARISVLKAAGSLPPALDAVLTGLAAWTDAGEGADPAQAAALRARLEALRPQTGPASDWYDLQLAYLVDRLKLFMDVREECRDLWLAVKDGKASLPQRLGTHRRVPPPGAVHRDPSLALWSGAAAALSILLFCGFWIATGWTDGVAAAEMVAVAACLMASQDDPAPAIVSFTRAAAVAVAAVVVYSFAILPAIDGFPLLALALGLYLIPAGALISMPGWGLAGLGLAVNFAALVGVQERFSADFASILNSDMSALLGMLFSALVLALVRSMSAEQALSRLLAANAKDLAGVAAGPAQATAEPLAVRMLDRLGLMTPRLARAKAEGNGPGTSHALREVTAAINVADLKRARVALPAAARAAIDGLLAEVAARARGIADDAAFDAAMAGVRDHLDGALRAVLAVPAGGRRDDAATALVALRCSLMPDAPAFAASAAALPAPAAHPHNWKEAV